MDLGVVKHRRTRVRGQWILATLFVMCSVVPVYSQGGEAPTDLGASADGSDDVVLTWRVPAENAVAVTGYRIRHTSWTSGLYRVSIGSIRMSGGVTRRRFDVGDRGGARYFTFEVRAVRGSVTSGWSNLVMYDAETSMVVTVPVSPSGLSAAAGVGEVALTWDDPGQATIVRYQVKYSRGAVLVQDWTNIAGSGAVTTDHTVTGLTNGTAYTFAVRAVSAAGRSPASSVSATPVPGAPANLKATVGDGWARLSWDDPMDGAVTGYQFRYSPGGRRIRCGSTHTWRRRRRSWA